jgi:nucleotide-binding universal stress UspA family protein
MDVDIQTGHKTKSLLCVGESGPDPAAIHLAEQVSHALGLELVLMHVKTKKSAPELSGDLIESTRDALTSEPEDVIQLEGEFKAGVLDDLELEEYRLVIIGTSLNKPNEPLSKRSRQIAIHASDSVLVIHNPPPDIRRILVCTGGHPSSNRAIDWGLQLAKALGADLTILHIVSTTPSMYIGLDAMDEGIEEVLARDTPLTHHLLDAAARAKDAGVNTRMALRHGMVAEEILRACEVEGSDLLVLGSPEPRSLLQRVTLGRVAPQILASSPISTLIVRAAMEE